MHLWLWIGLAHAGWLEDRQADYNRFVTDARLPSGGTLQAPLTASDSDRIVQLARQDPACAPPPSGTVGYERRCIASTGERSANACASLAALAAIQVRTAGLDRGDDQSWQLQLTCGADVTGIVALAGVRAKRAGDAWADGRVEVIVTYVPGTPIFTATLGHLPASPLSPQGAANQKAIRDTRALLDVVGPGIDAFEALRAAAGGQPAQLAVAAAQAKLAIVPVQAALASRGAGEHEVAARAFVAAVGHFADAAQAALQRSDDPARAAQDWAVDGARIAALALLAEFHEATFAQATAQQLVPDASMDTTRRQVRVYAAAEAAVFGERVLTTYANTAMDSSFGPGYGRASAFLTSVEAPWQGAMRAARVIDDPVIGPFTQAVHAYVAVLARERDAMSAAVVRASKGELSEPELGAALNAAFERLRAEQTRYAAAQEAVKGKVGF